MLRTLKKATGVPETHFKQGEGVKMSKAKSGNPD